MHHIAFATYSGEPSLTSDDRLACEVLAQRGIEVSPWIWDEGPRPDAKLSAVIVRSCWNYHIKSREFLDWLTQLDAEGVAIHNPLDVIRWNTNKKYLLELGKRGVTIPRTVFLEQGTAFSPSVIDQIDAAEVVIKPAISLNGVDTYRCPTHDTSSVSGIAESLLARGDVLIQEYLPEIATDGEISLVFFGGEYSHSVKKHPREGEFRIQVDYGGTRHGYEPEAPLIDQARDVLAAVGSPLLYARVDGIERNGKLVLMELEVIDPLLFLEYSTDAAARFADAISRRLPRRA